MAAIEGSRGSIRGLNTKQEVARDLFESTAVPGRPRAVYLGTTSTAVAACAKNSFEIRGTNHSRAEAQTINPPEIAAQEKNATERKTCAD